MTPSKHLTCIFTLGLAFSLSAQSDKDPQKPGKPATAPPVQSQTSDPTVKRDKTMRTDDASRSRTADVTDEMLAPVDKMFVLKTAQDGLMEVKLSQLAQTKGTSDAVKSLAQKIEQDHSKANQELLALAKAKNISVPEELAPKNQQHLTQHEKQSAAQFEKRYLSMMSSHHKKAINAFEKQANNGIDSDVKEWAAKTLPTLREHLRMVEEARGSGTRSRAADAPAAASADSDTKSGKRAKTQTDRTSDPAAAPVPESKPADKKP